MILRHGLNSYFWIQSAEVTLKNATTKHPLVLVHLKLLKNIIKINEHKG